MSDSHAGVPPAGVAVLRLSLILGEPRASELLLGATLLPTISPGFEAGRGDRLMPACWIRGRSSLYIGWVGLYSFSGFLCLLDRHCTPTALCVLSLASLSRHWICAYLGVCLRCCVPSRFSEDIFTFPFVDQGSACALCSTAHQIWGSRVPNTCIGGSGTRTDLHPSSSLCGSCSITACAWADVPWWISCRAFSPPPLRFSPFGPLVGGHRVRRALPACCRAPNSCIGGAGTRAFSGLALLQRVPFPFWVASTVRHWAGLFFHLSAWASDCSVACVAFFSTLLVMLGLALLGAVATAVPVRGSAVGRLLCLGSPPMPRTMLRALAVATPSVVVCDWRPHHSSARLPARPRPRRSRVSSAGVVDRVLVWLLGFGSCPQHVWGMPSEARLLSFLADPLPTAVRTETGLEGAWGSHLPSALPEALEETKISGFRFVSAPLPGPAPTTFSLPPALGVTIHAPHFLPTFFGLQVPPDATVQDVLHASVSLGKLPHPELDTVIPVINQRFDTALGLLAFPSCLSSLDPPHCAVLLDLTRVGGHYHSAALPCTFSRHDLFEYIATLIWHDTCDVEVWVDESDFPASHGLLAFASGSVLTVLLRGHRPGRFVAPSDVLKSAADWGPFEQSPSPRRSVGEAFVNSRGVVKLRHNSLSEYSPESGIRKALDLDPFDLLLYTERPMHLDVNGDHCNTVFAGPASACPWLLDLRLLGFSVRAFFGSSEPSVDEVVLVEPSIAPLKARLCLRHRPVSEGRTLYLPVIEAALMTPESAAASCGWEFLPELTALSEPEDADAPDETPPASHAVECKGPSEATPALRQAVASDAVATHAGILPEPFMRIGETPPVIAHVIPEDDDDDGDEAEARFVSATVLLFACEHTPERVQLRLPVPCTVEDVVSLLADTCDYVRYSLFSLHVPAEPQPSQWWLAFLALPAWAQEEPVILLNLGHVDGRCYASPAPSPFRRDQILRLAQMPDDGSFEVFAFGAHIPMTADDAVPVVTGGTITVRRAGARRVVQGHGIATMLISGSTWDDSPAIPEAPSSNRGLLVHGHGHGIVHPRSGGVVPSAAEIADLCGASASSVQVVAADPMPTNVACHGFPCRHVFGVSFLSDNDLTQGDANACVTFIDCRPMLQGWSLEISESGRIDHAELIDWLDTFSPPDWQPQLLNVAVDEGFVLASHGSVIIAEYVPLTSSEDQPAAPGSDRPPSSDDDTDAESSGGDSGSSDLSHDSTAAAPAPDEASRPCPSPRARSRSPRRHSTGPLPWASIALLVAEHGKGFIGVPSPAWPFVHGLCCRLLTWMLALLHDAVAHGQPVLTSMLSIAFIPRASASRPLTSLSTVGHQVAFVVLLACLLESALSLIACALHQLRFLAEPCPTTVAGRTRLAVLRHVTARLGASLHYVPPPDALWVEDGSDSDSAAADDEEQVRSVPFLVLAPGFAGDRLSVTLSLPATVAEIAVGVQAARAQEHVWHFPRLIAANPQPFPGVGVLLSCPAWHSDGRSSSVSVCIDTAQIDGRVFTTLVPSYMNRHQLIAVANLPPGLAVDVYVGAGSDPLADDAWCNLVAGDTASFCPDSEPRAAALTLDQLLSPRQIWNERFVLPGSGALSSYCLVHEDGNILHIADYGAPTAYRSQIAAAIGVREQWLQLYPARPRVGDACVDGVVCRTVIAVCEARPPTRSPFVGVLLDLRFILRGWQVLYAPRSQINHAALVASLQVDAPPGWRVVLRGVPPGTEWIATSPGQVFVAALSPSSALPMRLHAVGPSESGGGDTPAAGLDGASQQPASSSEAAHAPVDLGADAAPASVDGPGSPDGVSAEPPFTSVSAEAIDLHFLVLTPEYTGEHVVVRTGLPLTIVESVALVASSRDAERARTFPRLITVPVQPALSAACVIAMPSWESEGIPVVFVSYVPPLRVFARCVPSALTVDGVLRLAGIDEHQPVRVFVADTPWPVDGAAPFHVDVGDLVTVLPEAHPAIPPLRLRTMLASPVGWHDDPLLPLPRADSLWIVADQVPFRFQAPSPPRPPVRGEVAQLLDLPEHSLHFIPADPCIRDHARGGLPSRQVFIAAQAVDEDSTPYILDLRPVLLHIDWDRAPRGCIDIGRLCARHRPRCPPGYFIWVRGGFAEGNMGNHFRWVHPGQVITVEFCPRRGGSLADEAVSSATEDDASAAAPQDGSVEDGYGRFATSASSYASSARHDAGTGGTRHNAQVDSVAPQESPHDYITARCFRMWRAGFSHDAFSDGSRRFTPACPCLVMYCLAGWVYSRAPTVSDIARASLCIAAWWVSYLLVLSGRCAHHLAGRQFAVCFLLLIATLPSCVVGVQIFHLAAHDGLSPALPSHGCSDEVCTLDVARLATHSGFRPVATPCRAIQVAQLPARRTAVSPVTVECSNFSIRTLLEESRDENPCQAYFEARVLVETLVEHFAARDVASSSHGCPLQLSLSGLLDGPAEAGDFCSSREPTRWYNLDDGVCVTPLTQQFTSDLGRFCPLSRLQSLPSPLDRPERFLQWVSSGSPGVFPPDATMLCLTSDGSFFSSSGAAGWGVVLSVTTPAFPLAPGRFVGAVCGNTAEVWGFGGTVAGPVNAYSSELVGLLWAAVVAFQCKFHGPTAFFCDNLAALGAADGTCACPSNPVARACQDLHQGLAFSEWGAPSYAHVRGHSGDPANELADAVAGFGASAACFNPFSLDFGAWFSADAFRWVPHYCWSSRFPEKGPRFRDGILSWSCEEPPLLLDPVDVLSPFTRALPCPANDPPRSSAPVCFAVASFNTLSIVETGQETGKGAGKGAGLYGCTGRVALLDGALHHFGVFIAGLQETRTPAGQGHSTHFARYSSGCHERRALGVELWIATGPAWPQHTTVVLHTDPTRLCARVTFAGLQVCVLVAHAPHAGHSHDMRSQWWAESEALCSRTGFDERWLFMVDANCKVGHVCSSSIGPLHADPVDAIGEHFHSLLRKCAAWLPSTFSDAFHGDGGTLVQKRSGGLVRSDYVALPLEWRSSDIRGCVEPRISAGHAIVDHFAVLVAIELRITVPRPCRRATRIDTQALMRPENADVVRCICEEVPSVDWQVGIHDHTAVVVDALYQGLAAAFPLKGRRLSKHFLSEETAAVHQRTAALRHALRWRLLAYRAALTRCAFRAWMQRTALSELFTGRWLHQLRLSIARSSIQLGLLGKEVRRLCRRDRASHFSSLAEEAESAPPGQIHVAIKKVLRPKKFRRGGAQPLARLVRPDGSLCETAEQVADEWRRHFAALEGGHVALPSDLVNRCVARQRASGALASVSASEVPSFGDLVRALKGMQPFRAAGPDLVPPSLCARFALPVARLLWPVLLKGALMATESIGMKGGTLHHIAKASSHNSSFASAQRGILLQPVFSKAIHKTLRGLPAALFEGRALDLQIGGRKGLSYEFGHFMSRNFLLYAKASGRSAALVFSDLAAAYYAVVREVITGAASSTDPLERVTASLGLSEGVLQEIQHLAFNDPILGGHDCSALLRSLMCELHTDTWFHLAADSTIVRTTRGTRPGSSIADVAFNLLFEKVLARRGTFGEEVTPVLCWSGSRALHAYSAGEHGTAHSVTVQDIVYADDHAACVIARSAAHLVGAVSHVMGRSLDAITAHGLSANIGPTKTAALLVHRGRGAKAARDALFSKGRAKITVLREHASPVRLDAVPSYRHLGSILSYNGSLLADVRARVGRAKAEFGEGRRRVFCCPQIQL